MLFNNKNTGEFYRGKRRKIGLAVIIPAIVIAIIIFALMVFYGLQKYIVVTNEGIRLDIPFINGGTSVMSKDDEGNVIIEYEKVDAELVIGEADYSNIIATAGDGLEKIKAGFIYAASVNENAVNSYLESHGDLDAVVLDLKPASGKLAWKSGVDFANAYGLNGETELEPIISALKEKKLYVAAQLSCFVDSQLASHYSKMVLTTDGGLQYTNGTGTWLDPFNSDLRSYILALCRELADMGVDEIILNNVKIPEANVYTYDFSASSSTKPTALSAVSGFSIEITRALKASGIKVSARCDSQAAFTAGEDITTAQNAEFLFKVYDRVYCYTNAESVKELSEGAADLIEIGSVDSRFVPMCGVQPEDSASWVLAE